MKRIYVAGPLTQGNERANVRQAIHAAQELIHSGYAVYVPHLSWLLDMVHPMDYELMLAQDFEWIKNCDALIRLPGESAGADREIEFCKEHGIPYFIGSVADFHKSEIWETTSAN